MTLHESFGKVFAALEYGTFLGWSDNGNICCTWVVAEFIVDAFYQWIFRSHYYHVNVMLHGEVFKLVKFVDANVHVLAAFRCAGVPGSDIEFVYLFAFSDFPCEGVFTSAAA